MIVEHTLNNKIFEEAVLLDKVVLVQPVTGPRRLTDIDQDLIGLIFKGALNCSEKVTSRGSEGVVINEGQPKPIIWTTRLTIYCKEQPYRRSLQGHSLDQYHWPEHACALAKLM